MNNVMTSQQPKLVHSSVQTFLCWHTSTSTTYNNNGHGIHHLLYKLSWKKELESSLIHPKIDQEVNVTQLLGATNGTFKDNSMIEAPIQFPGRPRARSAAS